MEDTQEGQTRDIGAGGAIKVTKAELGDDWPYTVDEGIIKCVRPGSGVWFVNSGKDYPVNGIALSQEQNGQATGPNPQPNDEAIKIKETLPTQPKPTVVNKSASEIINLGLDLCDKTPL